MILICFIGLMNLHIVDLCLNMSFTFLDCIGIYGIRFMLRLLYHAKKCIVVVMECMIMALYNYEMHDYYWNVWALYWSSNCTMEIVMRLGSLTHHDMEIVNLAGNVLHHNMEIVMWVESIVSWHRDCHANIEYLTP